MYWVKFKFFSKVHDALIDPSFSYFFTVFTPWSPSSCFWITNLPAVLHLHRSISDLHKSVFAVSPHVYTLLSLMAPPTFNHFICLISPASLLSLSSTLSLSLFIFISAQVFSKNPSLILYIFLAQLNAVIMLFDTVIIEFILLHYYCICLPLLLECEHL